MNRTIGLTAFIAMLAANAALLLRDVVPAWTAGDPPAPGGMNVPSGFSRVSQMGILDASRRRFGTIWTTNSRISDDLIVRSTTMLDVIQKSNDILTPELKIDTDLIYFANSRLKQIRVEVQGFGMPIRFSGKHAAPDQFRCEWEIDDRSGRYTISADVTRALGQVTRPFESLADLRVGQSWRLELLDPLAGILPGWTGSDMATRHVIVRVVGTEKIVHNDLDVKVFLLEAERIRAWVSPLGAVLRQEVTLPLLGKITLVDEPYDDEARAAARRRFVNTN